MDRSKNHQRLVQIIAAKSFKTENNGPIKPRTLKNKQSITVIDPDSDDHLSEKEDYKYNIANTVSNKGVVEYRGMKMTLT